MNPDFQFEGLDPTNRFAMDGLNIAYATVTTIKVYDTCEEDSLKLYVTISNLWDIEDQLYRLWLKLMDYYGNM